MNLARTLGYVLMGSFVGAVWVSGCAESSSDTEVVDSGPETSTIDVQNEPEDTGAKKDAPKDAPKDTKPPPPKDAGYQDTGAEGTPCPAGVTSETRYCGWCGTQERVCIDKAGVPVWGAFGACQGDKQGTPNACDPFVFHADVDCGNCGKMKQTCQDPDPSSPDQCTFLEKAPDDCNEPLQPAPPGQLGEPACKPNDVRFKLGASCLGANEGRTQTCNATCIWGAFATDCSTAPLLPLNIDIATNVGGTNSKVFVFEAGQTIKKTALGKCPVSITSLATPYHYVSVRNTTAKKATVSITPSKASSGAAFDSIIGWYASPVPPAANDDTARGACVGSVDDSAAAPFGALTGANAVVIPAGGFVTVYHACYSSSTNTCQVGSNYTFTVKTESLQ